MHISKKRNTILVLLVLMFTLASSLSISKGQFLTFIIFIGILGFMFIFFTKIEYSIMILLLTRSILDIFTNFNVLSVSGEIGFNVAALISMAFMLCGALYLIYRKINFSEIPVLVPHILLLIFLGISMINSENYVLGLKNWMRWASALILYILIYITFTSTTKVKQLVGVLVLSAVIPLGVGFYQAISNTGNHYTPNLNRIYATFVHPNVYAEYLILLFPLAFILIRCSQSTLQAKAAKAFLIAALISIFLTYSRVTWVGFGLVLLGLGVLLEKRLLIWGVLLALILLQLPSFEARWSGILSGHPEVSSLASRMLLWRSGIAEIRQHPLFGIGPGTFSSRYGEMPHNDYLRLLISSGVMGLASFLWIIISLFQNSIKNFRAAKDPFAKYLSGSFIAILFSYSAISLFDNLVAHPVLQWYYYAFAAIVMSISRSSEKGKECQGSY